MTAGRASWNVAEIKGLKYSKINTRTGIGSTSDILDRFKVLGYKKTRELEPTTTQFIVAKPIVIGLRKHELRLNRRRLQG